MSAITITFCDQGENHVGNQKIGQLATRGFTYAELYNIQQKLPGAHLIDLGAYLPAQYGAMQTGVLVIPDGLARFGDPGGTKLFEELSQLVYDKHALMYGQVRQKHARHNLCFADIDQWPDYQRGQGTIVNFTHVPLLSQVRQGLGNLVGPLPSPIFVGEANHYYDVLKCGIGYHSDNERKMVIGVRIGAAFPLVYRWYHNSQPISSILRFDLQPGDIYIMDEKAVGFDGKKRSIPILRHAAGCDKYIYK